MALTFLHSTQPIGKKHYFFRFPSFYHAEAFQNPLNIPNIPRKIKYALLAVDVFTFIFRNFLI